MASQESGSLSGLSAEEAQEFHRIFVKSAVAFTGWAFVAHVLVWIWRPWSLVGETAQVELIDGANSLATMITALV